MSIFKELREKKGWSLYQASKEMKLHYSEYKSLEEGTNGEKYLKKLLQMCDATETRWAEVKKLVKKSKD